MALSIRKWLIGVLMVSSMVGVCDNPILVRDIADVTVLGAKVDDNLGFKLGGAGDVDGNGLNDIVMGTHMTSCVGCEEFINFAYVVFGATDVPKVVDFADPPATTIVVTDFASTAPVAGLGDFNGDGFGDVILGDPLASPGGLNVVGRTFILFGGDDLPKTFTMDDPDVSGVMIEGGGRSGFLGFAVSRAGDINGDGYTDALLSAPAQYEPTTIRETFVVYGGTDVPDTLNTFDLGVFGIRFRSAHARSALGSSLSGAGDVNGDGYDDFLVGAEVYLEGSAPERAYLIYGGTDLPSLIDVGTLGGYGVELAGPSPHTLFGTRVSGGGDINGDGYDDFLVAAPNAAPGGVYRAGQVYVYFGGPDLPSQIRAEDIEQYGVLINGFEREARLGEALAGPGDINGDAYDDLILASPQKTEDVAIVFGSPEFRQLGTVNIQDLERLVLINPGSPGSFGSCSAFVGDVNGDGREDLMIGDRFNNETKGEAFLIYGGKFDATPTPTPPGVGDFSGWMLLGTGEVVRTTPLPPTPTPVATE